MEYIKLFTQHSEYESYINSEDKKLPNLSYCEDNDCVHFNPWYDPERFVAKFNITDTTNPTSLFNNPTLLKELEIDGVIYTGNDIFSHYNHTFSTTGIHTVKYTLNDGITCIYSSAFAGKTNMISITIPDTITDIYGGSFGGCISLTSINIPKSVTAIGGEYQGTSGSVFGGTNIKRLVIPKTVTTIRGGAFTSLNFENVIFETINPNATYVVDATNKIITNIASNTLLCAFNNTIAIPNTITTIAESAFFGCSNLTSITIPDNVTTIGNYAFSGCTGLTSLTIPNSVTSISSSTFKGCTGLTSITIPDSVTSIGNNAFQSCSNLTSITIGNGVTTINDGAFYGCTSLTSITIPSSVTSIGSYAFSGCTGLTSITSLRTTAPTIQKYTFSDMQTGGTLTIPTGGLGYEFWIGEVTVSGYVYLNNWTIVEQ